VVKTCTTRQRQGAVAEAAECVPQENVAAEVERALRGIIARRFIRGVEAGSWVAVSFEHAKDVSCDLVAENGKDEVAELEERVALLVLLGDRAIFRNAVGEIRPVPITVGLLGFVEDPVEVTSVGIEQ
jgi:hypothetical protein